MSVTLLTALLALVPPTGFTATVERLPAVRSAAKATVEVEALRGRIRLTGAQVVAGTPSELCPRQELRRGAQLLHCVTRQLWVELVEDKRGVFLEIRQLRGMPLTRGDDEIPLRAWSLRSAAIPDTCPGTLAAARGECALAEGNRALAKRAFEEALTTPDSGLARIRLGDMAAEEGRMDEAITLYAAVPPGGPLGRMAQERECELSGSCFHEANGRLSSTVGLQDSMKTEAELRMLRREVFAGRLGVAVGQLAERITRDPPACDQALGFCQAVTLAGLESGDESTQLNALSVFTNPQLRDGPYDDELTRAAAEAAERVGAPAFAAAALSSFTARLPADELPTHLLKVAQLYLSGRDPVRAGVILEYAEGRLGARALNTPAWSAVRRSADSRRRFAAPSARKPAQRAIDLPQLENDVSLASDLARAAAMRSRALSPTNQGVVHD